MKRLRLRKKINWKYIIGEILLLFIGINLAIWFNNWNNSRQTHQAIDIALAHTQNEIDSNRIELTILQTNIQAILDALAAYQPLYHKNSNQLLTTSEQMQSLQQQYPGFFTVRDSSIYEDGRILYSGQQSILFELVEFSDIAWQTTKSLDILKSFHYECLYELESTYRLQNRTQQLVNQAGDALIVGNFDQFLRLLKTLPQLLDQLEVDYLEALVQLEDCY